MFPVIDFFNKREVKQAIVVRTDLPMHKGKICAQVSHASVSGYILTKSRYPDIAEKWINQGQKKVILKIANEKEFFTLYEKIRKELPCVLIADAGRTQISPGTKTCFSIGPYFSDEIDKFTSHLKLL